MGLKKIVFVLFAVNVLCLIYFLSLAWFNRPALDDYCVISVYHEYGILGSVIKWYEHWQARLLPHLLNNIILKVYEFTGTLFYFTVVLYVGFVTALYNLLKYLLPAWKEEKWLLINNATFLFNVFVLFNFEFSTFYWVNVSTMYFGGLLAALFLVSELLKPRATVFSWAVIFIASLYAATSAENFAVMFFIVLGVTAIYFYKTSDKRFTKAGFAFSVFTVAMLIMLLAPGTAARASLFPVNAVTDTLIISFKAAFTLLKIVLYQKWPYLLFLLVFSFLTGSFYPLLNKTGKQHHIRLVPAFLFFLWLCLLPTSFVMGELGPLRAHTHIAFYIILFSGYLAFSMGNQVNLSGTLSAGILFISAGLFILIMGYKSISEIPASKRYSQMEDWKIELLVEEKEKNRQQMLVIPAQQLPECFVLQSNTLKDTSFFANKCLCEALKLNYPVMQKEEVTPSH